ncbi:unnamed protein product [Mytilus coruscus]|uniref:Uncharacterized protein n=1 Tax=Mytilus coruscus TaxID=42192 RepID=A0A6J8BV37_MYTCO|nr:unnamed protein product [Mytilus coruscus]
MYLIMATKGEAVTVPGTRQFHCVKAVAQGLIKTRRVSCTCVVCLDIEQGTCINNTYVDEWVEQTLTNDLRKLNQKSKSEETKGDETAFPRAGSVLANGNEESHLEVRTRMVIEIVTHEDVYLNEYYLNRGTGEDKHIVSNLVDSDSYIAGDRITPAVARRILREDTFNFAKLGHMVIHG